MVALSKSKYCGLWQCPKIAWLRKYRPGALVLDDSVLSRMEAGNEVGDLAMGLFGDYVEVTAYDGEKLDLAKMIADTRTEMEKETPVICEASFSHNGLYCAVDILKKDGDGWAIYEVKSSTKHQKDDGTYEDDKEVYIADISYQKYVLEHCGVKVTGTYLICLNGDYVFDGTLDLNRLFFISDAAEAVNKRADEKMASYSKRIANVEEEGREIIKASKQQADAQAQIIIEEARKQASDIIAKAERTIEQERLAATEEMRKEIASIAMLAAEQIVGKEIDNVGQDAIIDQVIEDARSAKWQN